jgi:outer membrane receptor protein involved in Fe transport
MTSQYQKFSFNPLGRAIALASISSLFVAQAAAQEGSDQGARLEEVIVTATKRELNMQDLGQSIQAFDSDDIKTLGFSNMNDYQKSIPSLSTVATRPGRSEVVFRGVSTGSGEWRTDSGSAVYFGEIPMTSATQAVDPRLVDVERLEALPGPQGTLFGSSSQSGAVRIIPNKADHSGAYGQITAGGTYMSEGDPGYKVEAYINLPLIEDKLTVRGVVFDSTDGGYIDNVYGTNIFSGDDNADVVEDNFNEWKQSGYRLSALWTVNDNWDAELMYMSQEQRSEGDWASDPNAPGLGDLEIVRFHKDQRDDDWWLAALTITGDLDFAELTVSSSYLDREVYYEFDANTDGQIRAQRVLTPGDYLYANVQYDTGFQPETSVNDQTAERITHEVRLASVGDSRLKWMVGAFYEKTDDYWDYSFGRVKDLASTNFGAYWGLAYDTYFPNTDDWYAEEYTATTTQKAVFGEMSFDINDRLTGTLGARWFEYKRDRKEFKEWPRGNPYETDIYVGKDDDTLYKAALNYDIDDDKMIYALWSEGFRLGGFNSIKNPNSILPDQYNKDTLTNMEVGLKSQWMDNRLQLNVSLYQMAWKDIQRGITDPDDWAANGTINMGDAELSGAEVSMTFLVSDNLTVDASYAVSDSELEDNYYQGDLLGQADPGDQLGARGQELAIAPPSKWWIGVEYSMPSLMGNADGWVRYDHAWQEEMYHDWWNALNGVNPDPTVNGRKLIEDQGEASLQFGLAEEGNWSVTLSIWNLWDDRNAQWVSSDYDGNFGPEGTWSSIGRYVNMPNYNSPRWFEITFTKDFN